MALTMRTAKGTSNSNFTNPLVKQAVRDSLVDFGSMGMPALIPESQ